MSPFPRRRDVPGTPDGTARGDRSPRAVPVALSARAQAGCSPTTSLHMVLVTLIIAVLLSMVVAARAFLHRRDVPGTPDETARGDRSPRAVPVALSARAQAGCSPTTSLHRVLVTLAIALLLSLVVAARAIVHAGAGMPDGPMRTLTLAIGQATLRVAEVTHLTWPWDRLAAALGNAPQPAVPPLLASGSAAPARRSVIAFRRSQSIHGTSRTPNAERRTPNGAPPPPPLTRSRRKMQQPLADPPGKQEPTPHPTPTDAAREVRPMLEPKRNLRKGYALRPTPPARTPPTTILTVTPSAAHPPTAAATVRSRAVGARRPTRHRSTGRGRTATAHQNPLWRPTSSHPLRLLVTGDSLPGYLGSILLNDAAAIGPVRGAVDVHDGTGLTRPDFVDWSLVARRQVVTYHPDAVVVWMGGNDFQNMTLPAGHVFLAGTPAWTREYQRRAEICMRIWTHGGARRIYWLAMPPTRDPSWAYDDAQIDTALRRAAARVPGAEYVDILGLITDHGRYADYVHENGQPELVREADGVHVNLAGSALVAHEVLRVLEREWHLG